MKHSLKLLAAAVVLALPAASFAGSITFTTPDATKNTYAKELVTSSTNIASAGEKTALSAVSSKLGFGVSANQTRFMRFDLTNGTFGDLAQTATWNTGNTNATAGFSGLFLTDTAGAALSTTGAPAAAPSITVIDGGNTGDNYVIYQITANAGLTASNGFQFQANSLKMTDPASPVTVKYAMFETAGSAAQNATSGQLANSSADVVLAQTASGIKMNVTPAVVIADVKAATAPYALFKTTANIATPASFKMALAALDPTTSSAPSDMTGFLGTTKLTLAGATDLAAFKSAASGSIFLDTASANCGSASSAILPGTINTTDNTVTFAPSVAQLSSSATTALTVCLKTSATNKMPIAAQAFTLALDTGKNSLVLGPSAAGQITRNGLVLRAPFFSDATGSSASINLANMTSSDIKFNVRCLYKGKAEKAGFQDQVLPGAQTKRLYTGTGTAAGIGCPSYAGTPATAVSAVELTFENDSAGAVNGTVLREASDGTIGMSDMTGNSNGAALNLNATITPNTTPATTSTLTGTAQ